MKRFIFLLFVIVSHLSAQDTLYYRSGTIKSAKISEISTDFIKFHSWNNLDGPLYSIDKNDIRKIKYFNGQVDSFTVNVKKQTLNNASTIAPNISVFNVYNNRIMLMNNRLMYQGFWLDDNRLLSLIQKSENKNSRLQMLNLYGEMKSDKNKQLMFGFGGLGIGVLALGVAYAGLYRINNDFAPVAVLALGGSLAISGQIISGIFKKKRVEKSFRIAELYNSQLN